VVLRWWTLPLLAAMAAVGASESRAESWRIVPTISWESTLTDNVNLSSDRTSDWVNQFTPGLRFTEVGAHTQLNGSVSVPMLVYARTSENNQVFAQANVTGTLEAIDKFLFVDAVANVSQQFANPFGARPGTLANATQNRYTAQTYAISPYIKGAMPDNVSYELRDTNTWTDANAVATVVTGRSYQNEIVGHVRRQATPGGWSLEYDRSDLRFVDSDESQVTEIERARGLYRPDPSVELSGGVGYEDNRFFQTRASGATYAAGIHWRPNDRTNLNANWEHRFFGSSYDASFDHTTRLSTWSIHASRGITNYPQQLGTLPPGADISGLLNALFSNRFQDPIQRQTLVDQLIRDRGLPSVLSGPVPLLTQQVTLVEAETATMGLLGARNSVFFTVFRSRSQPVESLENGPLSALLSDISIDNTQVGANVVWTHQLTSNMTLGTSLDWSRVTDNARADAVTRVYSVRTVLSQSLTALTSVYGGARYQNSRSNISEGFRETAVFVGLTHTFH
jgi:uncharacterized protein (PEP-CTERM system associated)